jgi:hypothetical protein
LKLAPRTPRDEAKAASMRNVPMMVKGLSDLLTKLPKSATEHVCDAAGVAAYGILHAAYTDADAAR